MMTEQNIALLFQAFTEQQRAETTDNTKHGKCSNCGECCSNRLPMTNREIEHIRRYIKRHNIKPITHTPPLAKPVIDGVCPFRSDTNRRCNIYEARPLICKDYRCDKFARGDMPCAALFQQREKMRIVDVRETFFGGK